MRLVTASETLETIQDWLRLRPKEKILRLATPFVTKEGCKYIEGALEKQWSVTLLTNFDPGAIVFGSLDAEAILALMEAEKCNEVQRLKVFHNDQLHAKLFVCGDRAAVLGSSNLTKAGLRSNIELGVEAPERLVADLSLRFDKWLKGSRQMSVGEVEHIVKKCEQFSEIALKIQLNKVVAFPDEEETYQAFMWKVLDQVTRPAPKDKFIQMLRGCKDTHKTVESTLSERAAFMCALGLIAIEGGKVKKTCKQPLSNKELATRLRGAFPVVDEFLDLVPSEPTTEDGLRKLAEDGAASQMLVRDLSNIKRWCAHLDLVGFRGSKQKINRVFRLDKAHTKPKSKRSR